MHLKHTHKNNKRVERSIEQSRKQKIYLTIIVTKFKHSYIQDEEEKKPKKQNTKSKSMKNVHAYMHFHYLINSYRTMYVRELRKSIAKQKQKVNENRETKSKTKH